LEFFRSEEQRFRRFLPFLDILCFSSAEKINFQRFQYSSGNIALIFRFILIIAIRTLAML